MTTQRTASKTTPATKVSPPGSDFTFTLTQTKTTKGAVRYDNVELGLNIYFRKEQLTVEGHAGQFPATITLDATFNW